MNAINDTGIELTYEATHHGPLTENPSLFVELGGSEGVIKSEKHAKILATAVADSLHKKPAYEKVAVGIGGLHYSAKFTKLALNGKYAFSHIMSKHYISNLDMLKYAFERSDVRAEFALIEWKSIKAMDREAIVRELNVLGIDYAKV
jgi:D-aminoacyl-tRNA deacylase